MTWKNRKIITLAVFVSQALVLSMIENLIPLPTAFPGVKLGLANIIVITTIVFWDSRMRWYWLP